MIEITKDGGRMKLGHKTFTYPAGEVGVRLDSNDSMSWHASSSGRDATITARLQNSADIMELLMVTDALRAAWANAYIHLRLPYVPYGRQDRRCVIGEAHSLKVFAALINAANYDRVTTFDVHSDVTGALLERVELIDQKTLISSFDALNAYIHNQRPTFVSPDAGANKKTSDLASFYSHHTFIRADKLRDLATGKIKEIVVVNPKEEVEGKDCLIIDDLCDAGGTFIGLATALKAKGAKRVDLYVTHGLFTKGLAPLLGGGIDHIYTTTAYHPSLAHLGGGLAEGRFTVMDLDETFRL